MLIDYICTTCGSSDVSLDAWAEWDARAQQWVLRSVFDQAFCHVCEGEVKLETKLVTEA